MFIKELGNSLFKRLILNLFSFGLVFFSVTLIFIMALHLNESRLGHRTPVDELNNGFVTTNIAFNPWSVQNRRLEIINMRGFYLDLISLDEFSAYQFFFHELILDEQNLSVPLELSYFHRTGGASNELNSVEGILINHNTLNKLPLTVAAGKSFQEEEFGKFSERIPVIFGSRFSQILQPGFIFEGSIFGRTFLFEVIGLLEENHPSLSHFGWMDNLDEIVLFPFMDFAGSPPPPHLHINEWNGFVSSFYQQNIQTYIQVENNRRALDDAFNRLDSMNHHYQLSMIFTAMNFDFFSNGITRNIITMNAEAILTFLIATCILTAGILFYFSKIRFFKIKENLESLALLGVPRYQQITTLTLEALIFTCLATFLSIFHLFFGTRLIVSWSIFLVPNLNSFLLMMFQPGYFPVAGLMWSIALYALGFFVIQVLYPIYKICEIYDSGSESGF